MFDPTSPAWKWVEAHLRARINEMRLQNDGDLDAVESARLRGRIALASELLRLPEEMRLIDAARAQAAAEPPPIDYFNE